MPSPPLAPHPLLGRTRARQTGPRMIDLHDGRSLLAEFGLSVRGGAERATCWGVATWRYAMLGVTETESARAPAGGGVHEHFSSARPAQ